jgi:hypothetical protein
LPEKAEQFLCHYGALSTTTDFSEKIFVDCDFTENCNQNCFVTLRNYEPTHTPSGAKPNENGKPVPAMTVAARSEGEKRNVFRKQLATVRQAIGEKPTSPRAGNLQLLLV